MVYESPSNYCGNMLLLYLYINIPVSFLYISKMFHALNLLNKTFVGTRCGLLEIVLKVLWNTTLSILLSIYYYYICVLQTSESLSLMHIH